MSASSVNLPVVQPPLSATGSGTWPGEPGAASEALLRIDAGFAGADDLLLLGGFAAGMNALLARSEIVWPQLRCLATIHSELIPRFLEWFRPPERVQPYLIAAFEAVADEDVAAWKKFWGVVVRSQKPPVLADYFLTLLRTRRRELTTLTGPGRRILRREAASCLLQATPEVGPLLFPGNVGECEEILRDDLLPAKWRAFSLASTLKTSKTRTIPREVDAAARTFLTVAPVDVLREYILRAQHILPDHPELWNAVLDSPLKRDAVTKRIQELGENISAPRKKVLLDSLKPMVSVSVPLLPVFVAPTLPTPTWKFEALLYSGIIVLVFLILGVLLLL